VILGEIPQPADSGHLTEDPTLSLFARSHRRNPIPFHPPVQRAYLLGHGWFRDIPTSNGDPTMGAVLLYLSGWGGVDPCERVATKAEVREARAETKLDARQREALVEAQRFQANAWAFNQFGRVNPTIPAQPHPMSPVQPNR
jgi:hypothetical protein